MSERLSGHPLSAAFPSMPPTEFEELAADVAKELDIKWGIEYGILSDAIEEVRKERDRYKEALERITALEREWSVKSEAVCIASEALADA